MYACVAACNLRSLQVQFGQFSPSIERLPVRHNLRDHSPLLRSARRQGLRIQQKRPGTSSSPAITPRGEDAVTRRNTLGVMRDILKGRTLARHNDIGEQCIIGVHPGASLDRRNHRYAYVGDVFQNLNTLVVNLAPDSGIRDVAERCPVDIDNEVPSRAGDDNDLVSTVLSDPVKRVDKFRVTLCVHNAQPAVTMELDNQYALGVPRQLQLAIGREIVRLSCLHGIVLSWSALCTIASRVPESSVASSLEIKSVVQSQISSVLVARRISDVKAKTLTDTSRTQFAHAFDLKFRRPEKHRL